MNLAVAESRLKLMISDFIITRGLILWLINATSLRTLVLIFILVNKFIHQIVNRNLIIIFVRLI
jgi:hypothetical protein